MIAVIADDFTGAAELAGISLRYGLTVKLYTGLASYEACDVCIVSSDSRSMKSDQAVEITRKIISALQQLHPLFIFKKIDSVLRGYVLAEIKVQAALTQKTKILIAPANPSLGRKIINGKYYINDKLIAESDFSKDPEFPVVSSFIKQLLNDEHDEVTCLYRNNGSFGKSIIIAEAASLDDTRYWTDQVDDGWAVAGAGDFFDSIMAAKFSLCTGHAVNFNMPHLYICGTTSGRSRGFVQQVSEQTDCVIYLNDEQLLLSHFSHEQIEEIKHKVLTHHRLIVAIEGTSTIPAFRLRKIIAALVYQLCDAIQFKEIFIEGGATAAAVLDELGLDAYDVTDELRRGVVRMQSGEYFITVKPGSYEIPNEIRHLYLTNTHQQ